MNERLSWGLVAGANWQGTAARHSGTTLYVPLSLRVFEALQGHLNVGRDFQRSSADQIRAGVGIEWRPAPTWLWIAERFRQSDTNFARAGIRWEPTPAFSVDLSKARGMGTSTSDWWTLGVTWVLDRWRRPESAAERSGRCVDPLNPP
ncbi:MAG: hypothetical protein ABIQ33_00540 [Caldimonas sp.]